MLSEVFTAHLEQSQIPPGFLLTEEATDDLVGETLGNKAGEGTNQLFETVLDGKLTSYKAEQARFCR